MASDFFVNERIRARSVRLIEDDRMIGILPLGDALARARSRGLDLVTVSAGDGEPPICRILDADRYRYERAKADRQQARRQRELTIETKEVQLRPVTDDNDVAIKARRARGFLDDGDRVKLVMRFRGRERSRKDVGHQIIKAFLAELGDHKVDRPLDVAESQMVLILAPTKSKAEMVKTKYTQPVPSGEPLVVAPENA